MSLPAAHQFPYVYTRYIKVMVSGLWTMSSFRHAPPWVEQCHDLTLLYTEEITDMILERYLGGDSRIYRWSSALENSLYSPGAMTWNCTKILSGIFVGIVSGDPLEQYERRCQFRIRWQMAFLCDFLHQWIKTNFQKDRKRKARFGPKFWIDG